MKSAIIGRGSISRVHEEILRNMGTLVAVADVRESAFEGASDVECYTDYKRMLEEIHPDVVHICTPHYLHAEMIIEALSRGINVLTEKPLCISENELESILKAESESSAQLGVCFQNRYNAPVRYAKEYLTDKKIKGASGYVSWHRDAEYYRSEAWRGTLSMEGGGTLINQAIHTLDLMEWLVGVPDSVTATFDNISLKGEIEVEDTLTLTGKGDVDFVFHATNAAPVSFPTEISIMLEGGEIVRVFPKFLLINETPITFENDGKIYGKECYGSGHVGLISDFYDCIKNNRPFEINAAEASKVMRTVFSAYKYRRD